MPTRYVTYRIAAAVGLACLPGLAFAAAVDTPRIGAATALKGQVIAIIDRQPPHIVKSGEEILAGERIKTGPGSSIVVEFLDKSTFQVGPNGDVVVSQSQVRPVAGATVRSVMINAGSFRSITALSAANSQTIISTAKGAFIGSVAVVIGEVRPQRVAIFPIDGPGTYVYASRSVTVPEGGAVLADGRVQTIRTVATNPAMVAVMAEAMTQLGGATATQPVANPSVGYVTRPTGAVAGITTAPDGYINAAGGTESKEEISPETQVAALQRPLPPAPELPVVPATFPPAILPPPPLRPPVPASP